MDLSISYLVPILINFNQKNCICMFDYKNSKVYFLGDSFDSENKKKLEDLIVNKIESGTLIDVQQPSFSTISDLLQDLNIEDLRKKYLKEDSGDSDV